MSPSSAANPDAICPQCRTAMVHVAVTPHPVVRNCNAIRTSVTSASAREHTCSPGKLEVKQTRMMLRSARRKVRTEIFFSLE